MNVKSKYQKIAFVKTGWAEKYNGDSVTGRYEYIDQFNDAHERFNFLPGPNNKFYAYIPPIGKLYSVPKPYDPKDWLVIFVAAKNGSGPLVAVGIYINAYFELEIKERPEYGLKMPFEKDVQGGKYSYSIVSSEAVLIPTAQRNFNVSGNHFKSSPIIYAKDNVKTESWREEYVKVAHKIYDFYVSNKDVFKEVEPKFSFPDAKHRKKVEISAIDYVKKNLKDEFGYIVNDRQKYNCGYDLLATRKKKPCELHIEVKGTSLIKTHFYMSRNEHNYINNPKWRLAIVTSALDSPKLEILDLKELTQKYDLFPFAWEGRLKND